MDPEKQLEELKFILRNFKNHETDSLQAIAYRLLREYYSAKADHYNTLLFQELAK